MADETSGVPLADFLRDLAIAWKGMLAYPPGHPSRTESFARAHRRLVDVLATVAPIVLGVSRDGLLHGETKIVSMGAQRLATALHRQRVAMVVIDPTVQAAELETFLGSLAVDRVGEQAPVWERLSAAGVRGILLEPIDYQAVVMTEEEAPQAPPVGSIWERVTRELLAGRQLSPHQREEARAAAASAKDLGQWIENLLRQSGTLQRGGAGAPGVGGAAGGGSGSGIGGGSGGGGGPGVGAAGGRGTGLGTGPGGGIGPGVAAGGGGGTGSGSGAGSGYGSGGGLGSGTGSGSGVGAGSGAGFGSGAGSGSGAAAGGPTAAPGLAGIGSGPGASVDDAALVATLGEAVAAQLGGMRGTARSSATREVLDLTGRLPAGLRQSLLQASVRALATDEDAGESLRAVAAAQPPSGVLSTLRQLHGDRQKLSASALRLARELTAAAHAARAAAAPVDAAAATAIAELFADRDVDRVGLPAPAPDDPRGVVALPRPRALEPGTVPDLGVRRDSLADDALARQLASTLLELIAGRPPSEPPEEPTLWRLEDIYRGFLLAGHVQGAAAIVEALRDLLQEARDAGGSDAELRRCVERLANREAIAALLAALPQLPTPATARQLVELLGPVAVRHLVAALPEETDRSRRHQLLDLLTSLGPAVVPHATLLLSDPRWFVVRNMVLLLRTVGDETSLPQVRRCAEHPDLRVRLEAIKSLFATEGQRSADLLAQAIHDRDPKVAEAAIGLVGSYNITQGVAPLVALLRRWDPFRLRKAVRVRAIRTLGRLADPAALPQLESYFRDRFTTAAREERLAAFEALGAYPEAARQPFVARGLRSRDPEIRALCARVAAAGRGQGAGLDETHV